MAHYAFLDENNIVTQVIVGRNEDDLVDGVSDWQTYYGNLHGQRCVRTSYNGNIRKNYAGIGYSYSDELDAFIPPKPYPSWVLNEDTCQWQPTIPYPTNEDGITYAWDEENLTWIPIQMTITEK